MNSVQESKNELEAAIRYAENAISSAQGTIESMEFRQEMAKKNYQEQTGRESMLEGEVAELTTQVDEAFRENQSLTKLVKELESKVQGQYDDIVMLEREVEVYTKKYNELAQQKEASSGPCGCQAYRDLEEFNAELSKQNVSLAEGKPTMPVIPRDVAIAIFREGVQSGINDAVAELEGQSINISENDYVGDFSISFERDIDLDDHLDLDWMRDKVGQYEESFVVDALKGLCASKEFECRIHGIDDND
jgi:predicted RNase H-like nuclease (RuvC/YqgF family)